MIKLYRLALLLVLLLAFYPLAPVQAAVLTLNVTQQNDANDAQAGDGRCDSNSAVAGDQCTLRAAIQEADAHQGSEEVVLPAGTFTLTLPAVLVVNKPVSIAGAGVGSTIIDGNNRYLPVFRIKAFLSSITGVTIQHGNESGILIDEGAGLVVTNSAIRDNRATSVGAGIDNFGVLEVWDSTIDHNIVEARGGGLNNGSDGYILIRRSTISNNEANQGGGIYNFGELHIHESTLSGNKAQFSGGAIINNARTYLSSVTITKNEANSGKVYDQNPKVGGGILNNGTNLVELGNTILAGNTTHPLFGEQEKVDCAGTLISRRYNLIGDGTGCTLDDPQSPNTPNDQIGTYANPVNPKLGALRNNGGTTLSHALLTGSPAIESGETNAQVCGSLDQRGATRPFAVQSGNTPRCDIGAFEVNVASLISMSPNEHVASNTEALTLTMFGSGFVPGSKVIWKLSSRPTTFVSATKLTVQLNVTDLAQPGTVFVQVIDPATGDGSNTLTFTITSPPTPTPTTPPPTSEVPTATAPIEPPATSTVDPLQYRVYLPAVQR